MIYIVAILVIFYFSWRMMPPKGVKGITIPQLKQELLTDDKVFVDVRTVKEFKKIRIEGFVNYPLDSDFSTLPTDRELIIICQNGMRATKAAKKLIKLGYTHVTYVRGGLVRYK